MELVLTLLAYYGFGFILSYFALATWFTLFNKRPPTTEDYYTSGGFALIWPITIPALVVIGIARLCGVKTDV